MPSTPDIRFCTASDGVSIAYEVRGSGYPIVCVPGWTSHLEHDWFLYRHWVDPMSRDMTVVRYDKRGTGLSDRNVPDLGVEARARDIEAVVAALKLRRFAIIAFSEGGPIAVSYAAQHARRVSHLVLFGTYVNGADFATGEQNEALISMVRAGWGLATSLFTEMLLPGMSADDRRRYARMQREGASADQAVRLLEAQRDIDVRHLLPSVAARTLVIHGKRDKAIPYEQGRKLAAGIPDARFVSIEGGHVELSQADAVVALVRDHLSDVIGESQRAPADTPSPAPAGTGGTGGTAVILFTDIAESTALTERLGDDAFRAAARELDDRLRTAIRDANGTPIEGKRLGDGLLATFSSARDAVTASRRCVELSADSELRLHVGLHAGDVIREDNNVFGGAVNIAARICDLCEPGDVLVSATVRDLARTSAGVSFDDRGDHDLKGVADPVRVYAVREG